MLIDTHAHLDEQSFHVDLDEVLDRAAKAGVSHILTIGISLATSRAAVELAQSHSQISAVVGIQPNYVAEADPQDMDAIRELAREDVVVAIGETGLDRYWDAAPLELQIDYFLQHIELAVQVHKPFVVHCREAEADVVNVLMQAAGHHSLQDSIQGVMHSFCGDAATAEACLDLGLHISFAGMLTFKKNQQLRDVARRIPVDRLLVETDSPYLAPVPLRGKRNEPANVVHTAQCLADVHNLTLTELAQQTSDNARRLFGLDT